MYVYIYTQLYRAGGERGREKELTLTIYYGPENIAVNRLGQILALSWKTGSINK